ncbi:hypothetical protein [Falsarthrobacter nasiphocae]|uniref:Uncharacterized protein n=1 Tax=Falsarthrobacter nasiphocae TaxID=189863 RepID=A0AAE4C8E2_9MICC|nr:hypothetical protein [Falsarthrobacter nasiphocae]MDR6892315.1 hypothetical protein [Falsarthrobacter nasiphocae]
MDARNADLWLAPRASSPSAWNEGSGPEDVANFAQAIIANDLLGAPDARAENYSPLHLDGQVHLAPIYDIASGLAA